MAARKLTLLFLGIVIHACVGIHCAQATSYFVLAERRITLPFLATGDFIQVEVAPGSSYCCELVPSIPVTYGIAWSTSTIQLFGGGTPGTIQGKLSPGSPSLFDSAARLCFIIPRTTTAKFAEMTVQLTSTGFNPSVECRETTLYGGFNTSVTNFNFLEITNTMEPYSSPIQERDVQCAVTARNTLPEPDVLVIDGQQVTVKAGSRTDVDIHSAAGSGVFGPIIVAHNGAPGSIKAVVSQYNITGITPLTFTPVAQEVLRTRSEIAGRTGN